MGPVNAAAAATATSWYTEEIQCTAIQIFVMVSDILFFFYLFIHSLTAAV